MSPTIENQNPRHIGVLLFTARHNLDIILRTHKQKENLDISEHNNMKQRKNDFVIPHGFNLCKVLKSRRGIPLVCETTCVTLL